MTIHHCYLIQLALLLLCLKAGFGTDDKGVQNEKQTTGKQVTHMLRKCNRLLSTTLAITFELHNDNLFVEKTQLTWQGLCLEYPNWKNQGSSVAASYENSLHHWSIFTCLQSCIPSPLFRKCYQGSLQYNSISSHKMQNTVVTLKH